MALVDQKTPRLGLLLPFTDNFLQDDVERLRDTFNLLDVLVVTRDENTGKIADDMLSDVIAKLDAQGKLNKANLPSTVVQTGPDGKIDGSLMPSIAVVDTFPVPNEASMLGLQCERGDIAIREDLGKTFILTQMPPSVLSNWRELTSTNVTSVNGKTGAITGLAASGINNDITSLTALSGPLRLGGDGAGDYDAVTMKQLRAASGGAGGASINGVMNSFIGAVDWFMGTRAKLPAGYLQADGQIVLRSLVPDIVAAMQAGMLNVIEASGSNNSDAMWQMTPTGRGRYSWGDGDATTGTTIRLPDLNGVWVHPTNSELNSIPGLFLRGDGMIGKGTGGNETGGIGVIRRSAAPNITGQLVAAFSSSTSLWDQGTGAFTLEGPTLSQVHNASSDAIAGAPRGSIVSFTASNANPIYGNNGATEVRPASVQGIWIIRASGTFTAQNTNFNVINGDATKPANNTTVIGGSLVSAYQVGGVNYASAELRVKAVIGSKPNAEVLLTDNSSGTPSSVALRLGPSKGFIEGLDLSILSSGVTVYPGAAVLGTGELVEVTSAITKALPAYVNSTFFSVYLFNNNGTPDIEISTTAPVKYYGKASAKGSDLSRRFLGYYRISNSGLLAECNCINGIARFVGPDDANPLLRLVAGAAPTTYTQVSMSGFIMTGIARSIMFDGTNSVAAGGPVVAYSGVNGKTYSTFQSGTNKYEAEVFFNVPNNPQLWYKFSSAPSSGGFFLDIKGFRFDR